MCTSFITLESFFLSFFFIFQLFQHLFFLFFYHPAQTRTTWLGVFLSISRFLKNSKGSNFISGFDLYHINKSSRTKILKDLKWVWLVLCWVFLGLELGFLLALWLVIICLSTSSLQMLRSWFYDSCFFLLWSCLCVCWFDVVLDFELTDWIKLGFWMGFCDLVVK